MRIMLETERSPSSFVCPDLYETHARKHSKIAHLWAHINIDYCHVRPDDHQKSKTFEYRRGLHASLLGCAYHCEILSKRCPVRVYAITRESIRAWRIFYRGSLVWPLFYITHLILQYRYTYISLHCYLRSVFTMHEIWRKTVT